ncbi:MAG: DNA repair protein RecO [Anaerolineales bacterium]|nr:DNA repair protein RecO [Anaerolineales bacterium]
MSRERTFRSEAVVLRRTDFGEADRLLTLYTREFGKITAVAKGARKPQSRKTGHVELFMRSKLFFAKGRDIDVITQAEMVAGYPELRADLVRATYASYVVELLDRFTVEDDHNLSVYELLASTLTSLTTAEDLLLLARYYELRLLGLTGFRPQLFQCVFSSEPIVEEDQFFSAELGGLLRPEYQEQDRRAVAITAVSVKVLRYLQTRPWEMVSSLRLKRPLHRELEGIMHHYLTYILERNLKSVDFLYRLRREAELFATSNSPMTL